MTKEEFINQELPIGTIFKDFFSKVKLKVEAAPAGMGALEACSGCYYNDTECIPNGQEAVAPQCSWMDRSDNCSVRFVRVDDDAEITKLPEPIQPVTCKLPEPIQPVTRMNYLSENYPNSFRFDGLDDAIIGVSTAGNIIYSVDKIIDIFVQRDHMTHEEAGEYFDYNVERTLPYMTDGIPPILMEQIPIQ